MIDPSIELQGIQQSNFDPTGAMQAGAQLATAMQQNRLMGAQTANLQAENPGIQAQSAMLQHNTNGQIWLGQNIGAFMRKDAEGNPVSDEFGNPSINYGDFYNAASAAGYGDLATTVAKNYLDNANQGILNASSDLDYKNKLASATFNTQAIAGNALAHLPANQQLPFYNQFKQQMAQEYGENSPLTQALPNLDDNSVGAFSNAWRNYNISPDTESQMYARNLSAQASATNAQTGVKQFNAEATPYVQANTQYTNDLLQTKQAIANIGAAGQQFGGTWLGTVIHNFNDAHLMQNSNYAAFHSLVKTLQARGYQINTADQSPNQIMAQIQAIQPTIQNYRTQTAYAATSLGQAPSANANFVGAGQVQNPTPQAQPQAQPPGMTDTGRTTTVNGIKYKVYKDAYGRNHGVPVQ